MYLNTVNIGWVICLIAHVSSALSEVVKFLLEDNSKWMTGQIIPIDGGMSSVKTN